MKHLHADRRLTWLVLILGGLATVVFYLLSLQSGFRAVAAEAGPMENSSLAMLIATACLFMVLAARTSGPDRMVALGMASLCTIFFIREFDPRPYGPDFWASFVNKSFKFWFYSLLTGGFVIYLFLRRDLIPDVLRYSFSRNSWPLVMGGGFLVVGLLFEHMYRRRPDAPFLLFLEENFENLGFLSIFLAAIWFLRNTLKRA